MGLAHELHRAHMQRVARMAAAARRNIGGTPRHRECPVPPQKSPETAIPEQAATPVPEDEIKRLPATTESASAILAAVAKVTGIGVMDLIRPSRFAHLVRARQLAMWTLLVATENSKIEWAGHVLKRRHTTVLHGWREIEAEKERFREDIWLIGVQIGLPLLDMERQRTLENMFPNRGRGGQKCQHG